MNDQFDLETPAISALAAASKTPFATAFKITIGIGLGRLFLAAGAIALLIAAYAVIVHI